MGKSNEFKASTVELATKNGLEEMGLSAEEAEIEVLARGGIFSKAIVKITPKAKEAIDDDSAEKEDAEESETAVSEEIAENTEEDKSLNEDTKSESEETAETPEEREARFQAMKSFREPGKTFISGFVQLPGVKRGGLGPKFRKVLLPALRVDGIHQSVSSLSLRMFSKYDSVRIS